MNGYEYDDDFEQDADAPEEDPVQAQVWKLLLLINPGDEETALQQFAAYREATGDDEPENPALQVIAAIDWRSGFLVAPDDPRALIEVIDELSARWNLAVDWGGDVGEDGFPDACDVPTLLGIAHDGLAPYGYRLWAWETDDGSYAGWITATDQTESMRELAAFLQLELRYGSEIA